MEAQGNWVETDSDFDWDFHWADVGWIREHLDAFTPLQDHQRINHFQNHYELTRKDLLVKNLKRIKRQLQRRYKTCAGPRPGVYLSQLMSE